MMKLPIELIRAAWQRLVSGRISIGLWAILTAGSCAPIILDELIAVLDRQRVGNFLFVTVGLMVAVSALALMLYGFWKLERAAANYQDRTGDPFAWIGWGLLAYSPAIIAAFVVYRVYPDGELLYFETLNAVLTAFLVPLLVHSSGRAIDEHGPPMAAIWSYWAPRYLGLVMAYLLAIAPLYIASDIVLRFSEGEHASVFVGNIFASLFYLAGSVLVTALTVEAFHRAEQAEAEVT